MCAHLRERTTFFVPNCISDEFLTKSGLTTPSIRRGEMLLYLRCRRNTRTEVQPTGKHTHNQSNNER